MGNYKFLYSLEKLVPKPSTWSIKRGTWAFQVVFLSKHKKHWEKGGDEGLLGSEGLPCVFQANCGILWLVIGHGSMG